MSTLIKQNVNYWHDVFFFETLLSPPLCEQRIWNYANFFACILLASDWFKNNQLMSQLTKKQKTKVMRDLAF